MNRTLMVSNVLQENRIFSEFLYSLYEVEGSKEVMCSWFTSISKQTLYNELLVIQSDSEGSTQPEF